ncbi:hypothetical protein GALL_54510 [mine drainage metagenome]|uniref:Rho RNA-BD domain-containing protein n=1 Tax=mine drainage metagenome TaxID=410659 RepID=A0A1J5TBL5_9ZZZZ
MALPPKTDSDESDTPTRSRSTSKKVSKQPVKRVRTRKSKTDDDSAAGSPVAETGELFAQASEPEAHREAPAPEVREPAVEAKPASAPTAPERRETEQSENPAPAATAEAARPQEAPAAAENQPSQAQDAQPAPSGTPSHPAQGGQSGERQGPVIKDRNYWKNLKKEKKKWKQMQRQGGQGGGHGGGHGQHEKAPQQPPPPSYSQQFGDLPDAGRFADVAALDTQAAELASQAQGAPIALNDLYAKPVGDLVAIARSLGLPLEGAPPPRRMLLEKILTAAAAGKRLLTDRGWLDLNDRGYGFIVHRHVNYRLYPENTYVPESLIKRYGLKRGHELTVVAQAPREGERCAATVKIESAMGDNPANLAKITPFEELIPYYPLNRIHVEAPEVHVKDVSMRAVDILTPIGFGQRGLIVAPPRTGKTVLLHNIANSISTNFPEATLLILLVDERPEEVTDFKRHTKGEVISSTFDEMPENHVHAAEMVSEKAKRLVEMGKHVIILLDSITRLARAYNALASNSGKIMSGGIEATALQKPKRFFGAARNIEGAGSLTILGTALIDTGSRMDEVIFEEFKGTGNMELHLDRGLSDKRIFPAINIDRSGTRKEELIYHPEELQRIYSLRRAMQGLGPIESMDMLIQRLKKTRTNAEFLLGLSRT